MRRLMFLLALSITACQGSGGRHATTRDRERLVLEREQEWTPAAKEPYATLGSTPLWNSPENLYFREQAKRSR